MRKLTNTNLFVLLIIMLFVFNSWGQISNKSYPLQSALNAKLARVKIPLIQLEDIDLEKIKSEDKIEDVKNEKAIRFGIVIPTNIGFEQGTWQTLANGDRLWRVHIHPKKAKATNLYFDDFYLPNGATMHVYSPDKKQILGGFGAHNNSEKNVFATALIYGEEIVVEYFEPATVKNQGRIHISGVNHAYRMVRNPKDTSDYGSSGACQVNVNCSPEGDGKAEQRDATLKILTTDGTSVGWCTGTVMNNSNFDGTPYLLTAFHCIEGSSSSNLNQWVFYFNYQSSGCDNATEADIPVQTLTGATTLASYNRADWALLKLNSLIPDSYNTFYAGWDISENDFTGGYGIHHPAGDIKKVSTFNGTASITSIPQVESCRQVQWSATTNGHGVTEGGSSGSGLFNNNGHLIGTLFGGSSYCLDTSAFDYYGNIAYHGSTIGNSLEPWLNPNNYDITSLEGTYALFNINNSELSSIEFPGNYFCSNLITPKVTILNKSSTPLTSLTINYQVNSGAIQTYNWSGNLSQGKSELVTLPEISVATDNSIELHVFTEMPNGSIDSYTNNDSLTIISQPKFISSLPYLEDFQAGNIPSSMILFTNPTGFNSNWSFYNSANAYQDTGVGSCIMIDNYNNDNRGIESYLEFVLDLSLNTGSYVSFDIAYARYDNSLYDGLELRISSDCGVTYTTLFSESGSALATTPDVSDFFVPNASQWITKTVDLSSFDGNTVSLAFVNIAGYGQPIYLDNILVKSSGTLSVINEDIENNLKVFPNPASDKLIIKTRYNIDKMELYNILGTKVIENNNTQELNISSLANGVYILQIYSGKTKLIKRIVKQH